MKNFKKLLGLIALSCLFGAITALACAKTVRWLRAREATGLYTQFINAYNKAIVSETFDNTFNTIDISFLPGAAALQRRAVDRGECVHLSKKNMEICVLNDYHGPRLLIQRLTKDKTDFDYALNYFYSSARDGYIHYCVANSKRGKSVCQASGYEYKPGRYNFARTARTPFVKQIL